MRPSPQFTAYLRDFRSVLTWRRVNRFAILNGEALTTYNLSFPVWFNHPLLISICLIHGAASAVPYCAPSITVELTGLFLHAQPYHSPHSRKVPIYAVRDQEISDNNPFVDNRIYISVFDCEPPSICVFAFPYAACYNPMSLPP